MTLSSTTKSSRHTGTGSNDALATGFNFFADSEVEVWKITRATGVYELLTEDTEYQIESGGGPSGTSPSSSGTIRVVNGGTNFPTTVDWEIRRVMPLTQSRDYNEGDSFSAISIEGGLDFAAMHAQQLNKWVLLAEVSGAAQTDLVVSSTASQGWPDTYDAVRLELYGVFPSVAARIRLKLDDNGTESTTALYSTFSTILGNDGTTSVSNGSGWGSDSTITVGATLPEAVNGAVTFHARNDRLYGFGQYTYLDATNSSVCGAQLHLLASGPYTRLDGFYIDGSGGGTTVTGLARMWGMPKA